jgi:hypothetical protein
MQTSPEQVNQFADLVAERVAKLLRAESKHASPWMTPKDAATYLCLTKRGLEDMRAQSIGPRYHKVGARLVRYHRADLDCWLLSDGQRTGGAHHITG